MPKLTPAPPHRLMRRCLGGEPVVRHGAPSPRREVQALGTALVRTASHAPVVSRLARCSDVRHLGKVRNEGRRCQELVVHEYDRGMLSIYGMFSWRIAACAENVTLWSGSWIFGVDLPVARGRSSLT